MIFLSHSWQNKPAARRLVEALATECIPCWLDEQQLREGAELRASLRTAIAQSNVYLYLISDAANASEWVQDELRFALGLEHEKRLHVIPVRLADNHDASPDLLRGRLYSSLEATIGGAARLAHRLAELKDFNHRPPGCRLSATVRLDDHRLVHSLKQARLMADAANNVDVLLLTTQYEALDSLYWNVAEVAFPNVSGSPNELTSAAEFVAEIHELSRAIIREARSLCRRFAETGTEDDFVEYYDAALLRAIRVLLHRLQWNTEYLQSLRDARQIDSEFISKRSLPELFDGHRCEFVARGKKIGSIVVPKYGHPLPQHATTLVPWGLTSPFGDIPREEVGSAVGDFMAQRFVARSLLSVEIPDPNTLRYGLA